MKKKCIMALTIVVVMALLIVAGINRYIASGTSTPEAENFNNFLTAYEWSSSSEIGAGFMNFGTDGSFNYRGTDDGNGPWGYDVYDNYEYNSILNEITVFYDRTVGREAAPMKVLDYDLNYLALEIEGYRVEFNGMVKEDNSKFDLYRGDENDIAEHREISEEKAEELLGKEGYTEFIWCDEQGFVEKILFYRFYESNGEANEE